MFKRCWIISIPTFCLGVFPLFVDHLCWKVIKQDLYVLDRLFGNQPNLYCMLRAGAYFLTSADRKEYLWSETCMWGSYKPTVLSYCVFQEWLKNSWSSLSAGMFDLFLGCYITVFWSRKGAGWVTFLFLLAFTLQSNFANSMKPACSFQSCFG